MLINYKKWEQIISFLSTIITDNNENELSLIRSDNWWGRITDKGGYVPHKHITCLCKKKIIVFSTEYRDIFKQFTKLHVLNKDFFMYDFK